MLFFAINLNKPSRNKTTNPQTSYQHSNQLVGNSLPNVKLPKLGSKWNFVTLVPKKLLKAHYSDFIKIADTHAFFNRQTRFVMHSPTRVRVYTTKRNFVNVFEFNIKHTAKVLEWLQYGGQDPMIHKHNLTPDFVKILGTSCFAFNDEAIIL